MKRPSWLLLAGVCVGASATEVDETLRHLQGERLSLLDWGIYQLETELQAVKRHARDFIRAYFDPRTQRIRIDAVFLVPQAEVEAISARSACYVRHHAIKLTLGIIDTDRLHLAPAAEFRLGSKFAHQNSDAYPEQPDASAVGATLLGRIDVHVGLATGENEFPFVQQMRCDGAAFSQEVHYGAPQAAHVAPR